MEPDPSAAPVVSPVPAPPAAANTLALAAIGEVFENAGSETPVPRKQVISWAFWDWATQPFNSVILTFVFASLYLVSANFLPDAIAALPDDDPVKDRALADLSSGYSLATTLAGFLILLIAPVLGQTADRSGRKKRWLLVFTVLLALVQFSLFFAQADPAFFWYGALVLSVGAVVSEIAGVNYNAMLVQVSTPKTIGRVSGLGWGLGYIGGIVALTLVVVLTQLGWFGMDTSNGMAYRVIAVGCAVWTILFSLPLFFNVPEAPPAVGHGEKVGFFRAYVVLVKDIVALYKVHRPTFWFLLASAVYRDGLAGVFAFGGILAAVAFRFSSNEVLIFAIAANVVAGLSTILAGRADGRFGARNVIITALVGLIVMALAVFFLHDTGKLVFWIGGLVLSAFVGPAQAASRSLLARVTPAGMQGEIFGLYATTGRVASFLSPTLWTLAILWFGSTIWGVLGIAIVLAVGLGLLLLVRFPQHVRG
ncbi:MFS transporter [Microbacterium sp. BWT-B31]|uniref:MFS transporter n=1 Tax=Microbacterium sp. BWT-B31 TaxID=3232072 RepID=UPI0035294641